MKLSNLHKAYFFNAHLEGLQRILDDVNGSVPLTLKITSDENSVEILFSAEDKRKSLWEFLEAEIEKCTRELAALGVDVEG